MAVAPDDPQEPPAPAPDEPAVLAERRARKVGEQELTERAQSAERTAVALESRLDEAEGRLAIALRDRTALAASLERAEQELTTARQREYSEQRLRVELQAESSGAEAKLEAEIVELRSAQQAALERADALADALQAARREADVAGAHAAAERQAAAVDVQRGGVEHELAELHGLADELQGALASERTARHAAQRSLSSERERAAAELAIVRGELDRRVEVQAAIAGQVQELRGALQAIRARAETAASDPRTGQLERALATLEAEQQRTEARLQDTQGRLQERERELAVLRDGVDAYELELKTMREQAERERACLRAAEAATARAEARAATLQAELDARAGRERQVREALKALRAELGEARADVADRADREAAVESLVAEMVATAHGLKVGFEQEVEALSVLRERELASERRAFGDEMAAVERRVAELREQLTTAAGQLRDELGRERTARWVAEAELTREIEQRLAVEEHAQAALDRVSGELEQLRAAGAGSVPATRVGPASAEHPALAGASKGAGPDADIIDGLEAAMARLREDVHRSSDSDAAAKGPSEADDPVIGRERPPVDSGGAPWSEPATSAPASGPWLPSALAALQATDPDAAERVLLAGLAVQAPRVADDVSYELRLPRSGRHLVHVRAGRQVVVQSPGDGSVGVDFRLAGDAAALAPLSGGGAPGRRLPGATVRGRRRRLRRLLRAMRAPLGLVELEAAGGSPEPVDLLALLCAGVPATQIGHATFSVAFVLDGDPSGPGPRVCAADGRLTVRTEDPAGADATVAVPASELCGVLAADGGVATTGDEEVVALLRGWLRGVQGRR